MRNKELKAMTVKALGQGVKYLEANAPDEKYKRVLDKFITLHALGMVLDDLTELGARQNLQATNGLTRLLKQAEA